MVLLYSCISWFSYSMTFFFQNLNEYGVDWDGPINERAEDGGVVVPETVFPLSEMELENLRRLIDPLSDSEYLGVDIYTHVFWIMWKDAYRIDQQTNKM